MRVLAIDYGEKRVGLAISAESGIPLALPLLERGTMESDLGRLVELVEGRKVEELVVGLPLNMNGSVGPRARAVLDFVKTLRAVFDLPVATFDERLTSVQATDMLRGSGLGRKQKRAHVNTVAAQLILSAYLEARRRRGGPPPDALPPGRAAAPAPSPAPSPSPPPPPPA
ncbi:MAG: Holliday junction resolvase RuvX [Planctomycetes bacterium]|nr:Holliday junction resolvase RuvX [Planctomycetota bacterium]